LKRNAKHGSAGFSLIEMLVASAVFAIVAAVAFIFYTAAQKSYKAGEEYTNQQESTRVAFDRMLSDIRLAGFNTNPDGDAGRVDEQVEGAWDTAVTIRGDFDYEDPTASTTPESSLAGSVYNIVSTGNDEIVTYVLAKPGPTGPDTLTFRVDANKPRTKSVQTIQIPNVVLVQNNPPYTLYRVTLKDVAGAFPSAPQASSSFIYEPVADNIRSMTFQYWPDAGAQLGPNTPASAADDIGGDDPAIITRLKIRKISVSVVGMTRDEDMDYTDASDASATTHFRKFDLHSDVNPENLGKTGVKDIDITPPPPPTNVALVPGHCQGMLVKWDTPSAASGVTNYAIKYWPSSNTSAVQTAAVTYPHSEFGVLDYLGHGFVAGLTNGTNYCFQVQAKDSVGNQSGWAPVTAPCAVAAEASTPATPNNLTATGNGSLSPLDSKVTLTWQEVKNNANDVTGDPNLMNGHTVLRDGNGYKLYRDVVSSFTPGPTNQVAAPPTLGNGVLTWTDNNVANCQTYYYKAAAVDTCDVGSTASAAVAAQAVTAIAPTAPTGVTATRTASQTVNIAWSPVTTKVDSTPTYVNQYKVYRTTQPLGTLYTAISAGAYSLLNTVTGATAYTDNLGGSDVSALNGGQALYYQVTAADLCGNESARSSAADVGCPFNGTFTFAPADGSTTSGSVPISETISGTDTYTRGRVRVTNSGGTVVYDQTSYAYPFSFPAWNSSANGAGDYAIHWEAERNGGCVKDTYTVVHIAANLACQITPTNPNLSPTSGKTSNQDKNLAWDIMNNSGLNLDLTSFVVNWSSNIGTHKLVTVQYPTGTTTTNFGTGAVTPATADYSTFPLSLPAADNGSCGTCKINMQLAYDTQIVDPNTGNGELITIKYNFKDSFGVTGSCQFTVHPDLSITGP
jgi:prepilin-type N-terminal cleavage/methylation domain-containing protein